jgi:hypothetical protein
VLVSQMLLEIAGLGPSLLRLATGSTTLVRNMFRLVVRHSFIQISSVCDIMRNSEVLAEGPRCGVDCRMRSARKEALARLELGVDLHVCLVLRLCLIHDLQVTA